MQYKVIQSRVSTELEELLNEAAADGWALTHVVPGQNANPTTSARPSTLMFDSRPAGPMFVLERNDAQELAAAS